MLIIYAFRFEVENSDGRLDDKWIEYERLGLIKWLEIGHKQTELNGFSLFTHTAPLRYCANDDYNISFRRIVISIQHISRGNDNAHVFNGIDSNVGK